eukprot:TRINITY_DN75037_c0_g1_i1.p2 TRINITY_DN75037_c0_g1~~TRINITY_DN75037_c0_g1_i1.p2  ORF type:complete len:302 (+),score=35.59 TRINITY_DN75037_c0_g1_i1:91-906(+)
MDLAMLGLEPSAKREAEVAADGEHAAKALKQRAGKGGNSGAAASGASTSGGGGAANGASRRRGADNTDVTFMLAKLALSHARQIATLNSILISTLIFQKEGVGSELCEAVKSVTTRYPEQTKEMNAEKRAAFPPPRAFVWLALCNLVKDQASTMDHEDGKNWARCIDDHVADLHSTLTGVTENKEILLGKAITEQVAVCRILRTWNSATAKLEVHTLSNTTAQLAFDKMKKYLAVATKGQLKTGTAPRGDLERKVQTFLDNTQGGRPAQRM